MKKTIAVLITTISILGGGITATATASASTPAYYVKVYQAKCDSNLAPVVTGEAQISYANATVTKIAYYRYIQAWNGKAWEAIVPGLTSPVSSWQWILSPKPRPTVYNLSYNDDSTKNFSWSYFIQSNDDSQHIYRPVIIVHFYNGNTRVAQGTVPGKSTPCK